MTEHAPNWRTLNAYVDGELDARDAAEVARAAGADAAVADQIALLYHLKGGVHAALPPAPDDLAADLPRPRPRLPKRAVGAALAAAAVAGLAALVLVWAYAPSATNHDVFMAAARDMHEQWLQDDRNRPTDPPPVVFTALTRFGRLPVVPDLESTGLSVGLVSVFDRPAGRVLQIGYRGHHGCHLSLFVVAGSQLSNGAIRDRDRLERSYAWQAGDLGYLLLAKGMDKGRFALIAEKVEHATRVNAPLDAGARQQLAENKRHSAACAA